jgi:predicted nuclease of predicted toxin-antitoxin system
MKFLVDAQLPPGLCSWLEERGHEAVHVAALSAEPVLEQHLHREGQAGNRAELRGGLSRE